MCKFFSAIVLKNGDVLHHEATDSYSDLVAHFKLPDKDHLGHFAKVEFTPPRVDGRDIYEDWNSYQLRVDEPTKPQWFDDVENSVVKKLQSIIRAMIVDDARPLVLGGCRILVSGAKIDELKAARVVSMSDTASVVSMSGTARVVSMSGTASVVSMSDTASVGSMSDTASVPRDPSKDRRIKRGAPS